LLKCYGDFSSVMHNIGRFLTSSNASSESEELRQAFESATMTFSYTIKNINKARDFTVPAEALDGVELRVTPVLE